VIADKIFGGEKMVTDCWYGIQKGG
jgi:hypothetical protein